MNTAAKWFRIVVWIGILANWGFALGVYTMPRALLEFLKLGEVNTTIWLFNYSVLLTLLSCFYIPAAADPTRYIVNAWLLVACRLIPATTFFVGSAIGFMPRGFITLGVGDSTFGIIEAILLIRLLSWEREHRPPGQ